MDLAEMAASAGVSYDVLAWTAEWYFREETLEPANAAMVGYHHRLPMAGAFGTGTLAPRTGNGSRSRESRSPPGTCRGTSPEVPGSAPTPRSLISTPRWIPRSSPQMPRKGITPWMRSWVTPIRRSWSTRPILTARRLCGQVKRSLPPRSGSSRPPPAARRRSPASPGCVAKHPGRR
jgi:Tn3 transposase DDE domain